MCMSKGAPKKPSYGPCHETHGQPYVPTGGYCYGANSSTGTSATTTATWYSSSTAGTTGGWFLA